jgi:hypothetical protein
MRVGTTDGVRLEHIREWALVDSDVVLKEENGFSVTASDGTRIRVGQWGAPQCTVSLVSDARMQLGASSSFSYDGSCSEQDEEEEEEELVSGRKVGVCQYLNNMKKKKKKALRKVQSVKVATAMLQRMAVSVKPTKPEENKTYFKKKNKMKSQLCRGGRLRSIPPRFHRREWCINNNNNNNKSKNSNNNKHADTHTNKNVQICLQDARSQVLYVWIIAFSVGTMKRMEVLPHPYSQFRVENSCGSCTGLFDVDFMEIKQMATHRKKKGCMGGDIISTLGGTLSLCPERYRIDFRGTRSMRMLAVDWDVITRKPLDETTVSAYMLVLKGRLGAAVILTGTDGHVETCYIANRMQKWCDEVKRNADVCDSVELKGIRWNALFYHKREVSQPLLLGKSSVHISRRGGVMMRVLFPRQTQWSIALEENVVADCNELLQILRTALNGKAL